MTPEQALQYLMSVLVLRAGLNVQEAAQSVQAWNVIAEAIKQPKPIIEENTNHKDKVKA